MRSLQRLAERTGHVMLVHLGLSPVTVVSSKEAAEEVLRTHDLDCCTRPNLAGPRLISRGYKDIGFTQYSEEWKERRKFLVRELFSLKKVQSSRYIREEECNFMAKKLFESAVDRSTVDLSKTLYWLTASIFFKLAFGHSFHESKFVDQEKIDELVFEAETALASFTCSDFFPVAGVGWLVDLLSGQHKRLKNVFFKLDAMFQHMIDDHLISMLDVIHIQEKDDSLKLTVDHMKGVLTLPDGMTERDIDIEEAGTLTVVKKVPLKLVPVLSSLVTPNSSFRK
ncbi:hypothetical protein Bca52824_059728 [Brassica carinata]|uniref:Cytochrome P450 n=1 Tax=Brassica carinata TaxID=52824 RepID=A0A8X7R052_BRACI|nr:hypothetical protein Bca52824_059728 [Brassica carinata]